jgi:hypothetical protein
MGTTGKGRKPSGKKGRPEVGTRAGTRDTGPGMDAVLRGEMPANPDAEIEARRSDRRDDELPPDAQAARQHTRRPR